jgi:hypothetical protein
MDNYSFIFNLAGYPWTIFVRLKHLSINCSPPKTQDPILKYTEINLTRKEPTPEPYRCAGLKLVNIYYETAIFFGGMVFSEVDLPGKRKKVKNSSKNSYVFGPSDTPSSPRQRRTPIF